MPSLANKPSPVADISITVIKRTISVPTPFRAEEWGHLGPRRGWFVLANT